MATVLSLLSDFRKVMTTFIANGRLGFFEYPDRIGKR
jgi:hypothetical protein